MNTKEQNEQSGSPQPPQSEQILDAFEATLRAIDAGVERPAADQWHASKAGNRTIKVGDRQWTVKKGKRGFFWMMYYRQDTPEFSKSSFTSEAGAVASANESICAYEFGPYGV